MALTLAAILRAARSLYVVLLLIGSAALLFPPLGLDGFLRDQLGGDTALLKLLLGAALLGLLVEHSRVTVLQTRQSYLAEALRRRSEVRIDEAVKILIQALDSKDESVISNAHRELVRITREDLGTDSAAWREWLARKERG